MIRNSIVPVALAAMLLLGCAGTQTAGERRLSVTCPVSGEEIGRPSTAQVSEYKGEKYYFCCVRCKEDFEKDPERYIGK